MTNTFNRVISLAIIMGLIALTAMVLTQKAFGSAPSGLPATVATSTFAYPVGTSQTVLFATSTCAARVITTRNEAVMLSFNEPAGQVPTVLTGHSQVASTTVVYDSGQYGCGAVRVISATGAATAVSVSESR
jgi:hypothetical protein